jgi:hypothetical protein
LIGYDDYLYDVVKEKIKKTGKVVKRTRAIVRKTRKVNKITVRKYYFFKTQMRTI